MPVTLDFSGSPSVSKRWRASVIVRGFSSGDDLGDYRLGYMGTVGATPPTMQDSTHVFNIAQPLAKVEYQTVKSLTREGLGDGRMSLQQTFGPGDLEGLAVGQYLWAYVQTDAETDTEFLALGGPLRVRA